MSEFKVLARTAPAFASSFVPSRVRSGRLINSRAMPYPISVRTICESAVDVIARTYAPASRTDS
jgi:hypothetical protein